MPTPVDGPEFIEVDRTPTSGEEQTFFETEAQRAAKIANDSDLQDMGERRRYAENAYGITQTWIGFLIVITSCQFGLKRLGYGLGTTEFVTVFTTTTASIFGFWMLVGRYLFPPKGK